MYKATIKEGNSFSVDAIGNDYKINGESLDFDCQPIGEGIFHLIIENKTFKAQLVRMDKAKSSFVFQINGVEVELELEDKYDLLLSKLGIEKGAGLNVKNVQAPMPGLVLKVSVKSGDDVEEGEALLVLEAMKMENVIKAPKAGLIDKVEVEVGQKVDKGEILIHYKD
jgi:acetyl/propionyl-CoA carboxylase alpha subunit